MCINFAKPCKISEKKKNGRISILVHPPVPSRSTGSFVEDLSMEKTVNVQFGTRDRHSQQATFRYVDEHDRPQYAGTSSRDLSKHLPVQHVPHGDRARVVVPTGFHPLVVDGENDDDDSSKADEVLILDTIVQHVSEDEKSTSSEEVVFEEWSEAFRCRRTDEYDQRTNQLVRTTIDETSDRVKSDVIKEEYKEKNERIKGHKSYDIVKEVYRRVPAKSVDPTKTTVIPIDRSKSHLYEEIPQPPPPASSSSSSYNNRLSVGKYPCLSVRCVQCHGFFTLIQITRLALAIGHRKISTRPKSSTMRNSLETLNQWSTRHASKPDETRPHRRRSLETTIAFVQVNTRRCHRPVRRPYRTLHRPTTIAYRAS